MNTSIQTFLTNTHPAAPRTHRDLTLVPLFAPAADEPAYISLARALQHDGFRITEVSSGGSVPDLQVINKTPFHVFLFDGQELKGAKQNRVLNTSILVPAGSDLPIPVSCTESGRWSYDSPEFSDSKTVMSPKIRKTKSLDVSASYSISAKAASNQGKVWDEIEQLHACAETSDSSQTRAMKDAYDAHQRHLVEFQERFPCEPNQSGLLAIRNGRVEGADILSQPAVYRDLHESLVQSHALDALVRREERNAPPANRDPEALAQEFLDHTRTCEESAHDSPGLGSDHRLTGDSVHGSALVVDDTTIHLALFSADGDQASVDSPIASSRRRRSWHRRDTDEEI